ncbi:MerR family transcriptional regulator [Paenibacillus sp. N3.4]|uniref:MerR family transcriptional regulator n=1 Tax=Paenibacillus sp. N3.4 TaxID=2603222 RepID=UPI0021C46813|nr:MerR family transcriptional regulator [Paenibacillus sp. N3.4]
MKPDKKDCLTTGQMAKQTGLTLRTLRYYDQIGLLSPSQHDHRSKRLYEKKDMMKLQKIQTLKYIGLSLDIIKNMMNDDSLPEQDLRRSLTMQKEILLQKTAHMQYVVRAINEAMDILVEKNEEIDWKSLAGLIQAVNIEQDWVEQYQTASRLQARIDFYDKFSMNNVGWHRWFFEHLKDKPGLRILEIGCGMVHYGAEI